MHVLAILIVLALLTASPAQLGTGCFARAACCGSDYCPLPVKHGPAKPQGDKPACHRPAAPSGFCAMKSHSSHMADLGVFSVFPPGVLQDLVALPSPGEVQRASNGLPRTALSGFLSTPFKPPRS